MSVDSIKKLLFPFCAVLLAACGGDNGKAGAPGASALVMTYAESAGANCGTGGWRIETGSDTNRSGTLDQAEVTGVSFICNGEDGQDGSDGASGADGSTGLTALLSLSSEPAGANCAQGGQRVDTGLDLNTNGTLDPAEITSTAFICNGADGQDGVDGTDGIDGTFALIDTQVEPAGLQCASGGIRVTSGIDANRNGLLEIAEISRTSYLCNGDDGVDGSDGQNGAAALIASTQIPAGLECAAGGYRVDSGIDGNENGLLDSIEVSASFYVCNGNDGADGQPGENGVDGTDGLISLVKVTDVAPGFSCIAGGKLIETGNDLNSDGVLQAGEVQQSEYVCNGEVGQDGVDGQNGSNALVALADESPGANCAAGGVAVNSGMDINANGQLDSAEVQSTSYVCHGTGGPDAQTFTLNYSAQPGGIIVGSAVQNVLLGDNGSVVTAVPNVGYFFTAWSDGLSTATRAEIAVQSSVSVQAGFSPYEYILTYVAGSNGSVTGITNQTVFYGANGSAVTAIPSEGYEFVEWSDGLTANPRSDLAVDESVAVTARFEKRQYTLTYQAGPGGSVTGNANQVVLHGDNGLVVAAVPSDGYNFIRWSDGLTTTNRTDSNIQSDLLLIAEFRQQLSPPEDVVLGASNGSLVVEWESNPAADSYNVYYALEPGVTPLNYSSLLGGGVIIGASSPTTLTELSGGQRYYFVITTIIDGVESQPGQEITQLLPNTPWLIRAHQGGLRVELTSATTAVVDWDVGFAESYNIFIADNPETDLSQYSSYGAELRLSVTPPVTIENLEIDKPVYIALETNGQIDDWTNAVSKNWGVNGPINTQIIGADGNRYAGGDFTMAGMNVGKMAAVPVGNDAQNEHLLVMPEADGPVYAAATDGKGGWYIGGDFSRVDGLGRMNLAHIDSAGRVTSWGPGTNGPVYALLHQNGTIYVGGAFTAAGGGVASIARNNIASFGEDGSLLGWNPYANGPVRAIIVGGSSLYIGGEFTEIGGGSAAISRAGVARFSLSGETESWVGALVGKVYALAFNDNLLYVGGDFVRGTVPDNLKSSTFQPGITYRKNIAVFNVAGSIASPVLIASDPVISLVTPGDGYVYVGAGAGTVGLQSYQLVGSNIWQYTVNNCSGGARFNNTGTRICLYKGPVRHMAVAESQVLYLTTAGSKFGIDGSLVDVFESNGKSAFVGGRFDVAGGASRLRLASFDSLGYLRDWNPGANGPVRVLVDHNERIYAGGSFSLTGDGTATTSRNNLAAYDYTGNLLSWSAGVTGVNGVVNAIVISDSAVFVGGSFVHANNAGTNEVRSRLAAFDLSGGLLAWNPGTNGIVNSMTYSGGTVYAGGEFTRAGGGTGTIPRSYLAAFDQSGNVAPWSAYTDGPVSVVTESNGVLYASGDFAVAGGGTGSASRQGIAAFGVNGNLLSWNPGLAGGHARAIAVNDSIIYAAGNFTSAGGGGGTADRSGLAAFTLAGVLTDWQPVLSESAIANSLAFDNGIIHVGGEFTLADDGLSARTKARSASFDLGGLLVNQ